MRDPNSISSSVDVLVDPATAFKVFTEEVNCWWLQDVFGFFPASRIPDEFTEHTWIESHIGDASLILFARSGGKQSPLIDDGNLAAGESDRSFIDTRVPVAI